MKIDTHSFGERVKLARKKAKLTQTSLAKKMGVTQGTITHIENGRNRDSKYIMELANALSVRAEWLYYGFGNMDDLWAFKSVSQIDFANLPEDIKKDIEDYINFKIQRNKQEIMK